MAPHPDLDSEQAYIEHAYDRLDAMRASASATLRDAFSQNAGGTFGTGGLLTTSSTGGTTLGNANTVARFTASNSGTGNISLSNTAAR